MVELHSALPPAPPDVLDAAGSPRYGAYQGSFDRVDLSKRASFGLLGKARQIARLKTWHYAIVATPEVLAAFAIVDAGYASNAFAYVVDLVGSKKLADLSFLGLPQVSADVRDRPGEGARATFLAPGAALRISRAQGTQAYQLEISTRHVQLEAMLDTAAAPPSLAAIVSTVGGDVDCTQKSNVLPATGMLRVDDRTWSLAHGFGGLDFTRGLLPRKTAWRWAFGLGRTEEGTPVGLNVTDGLSDMAKNENALWIGGELVPVGPPRFTFDAKNPEGPWQVRTSDGAVDLHFAPGGLHREERNLFLVKSHFVQVAGSFTGTVKDASGRAHAVEGLPGVTEDQRVTW